MTRRLVVLDRDGVINEERLDYIRSPEQWRALPGSLSAIARLCHAGLAVAIATNQSGVGRGLMSRSDLDSVHRKMQDRVREAGGELSGVFFCPHSPTDGCSCRKPLPGLLEQIEAALGLPVAGSYMVGDSLTDLQAATAAGALPALVRTGFGSATERQLPAGLHARVFDDLAGFADWFLSAVR